MNLDYFHQDLQLKWFHAAVRGRLIPIYGWELIGLTRCRCCFRSNSAWCNGVEHFRYSAGDAGSSPSWRWSFDRNKGSLSLLQLTTSIPATRGLKKMCFYSTSVTGILSLSSWSTILLKRATTRRSFQSFTLYLVNNSKHSVNRHITVPLG